jgi:PAS domain S-box-containing protein
VDIEQTTKLKLAKEITNQIAKRKKTEQSLRTSEERYKLLIEGAKVYAIFFMNPQGIITSWNRGAQLIFGYPEKEILGKHFSLLFTKEDIKQVMPEKELDKARKEGVANDDRWHIKKNGRRFWASGHVLPLFDDSGNLTGFSKVVRDMN